MERKILIVLGLFISTNCFAQKEIFVDENNQIITNSEFQKKKKNPVLKAIYHKTDTVVLYRFILKNKFGRVSSKIHEQIKGILSEASNIDFNDNESIIIRYRDTLFNIERDYLKPEDSLNHKKIRYYNNRIASVKKHMAKTLKKCLSTYRDTYNTHFFNVYKYDDGYSKEFPNINWVKDNEDFKSLFFKDFPSYGFMIIKSDGEFFISNGYLSKKMIKKLLDYKDWSKFKDDWKKSYKLESGSSHSFFNLKQNRRHRSPCI